MRRILIVGGPGSGRTTLARALARRGGLPVVHLDRLVFLPGWQRRPRAEADAAIRDALREDLWIIEGDYARAEAEAALRADVILWLDLPLGLRLLRLFRGPGEGARPDLPEGCADVSGLAVLRHLPALLRQRQPARERHAELLMSHAEGRRVIRLGSPNEVRRLLDVFPGPERWQQMLREEEAQEAPGEGHGAGTDSLRG